MKPLRHPLQSLTRMKRLMAFFGSLALTFVVFSALKNLDVPLDTPASRWGMISFEFSGTVARSREILDSWNLQARDNAKSSLLLDFLFPVCYSTTLTIACFWASALFHERGYRKTGWLTAGVAWAQWPAGLLDYVENIALWMQLRGPIQEPWPRIAQVCATIKFFLIILGLCISTAAVVVWALRRRARLPTPP